jgi:hypothetical protein
MWMAMTREEQLALGATRTGEARSTGSDAREVLSEIDTRQGFAGLPEALQPSNLPLPVGRVVPITASPRAVGGPGTVLRRNAAGQVTDVVGNPRPPLEQRMHDLEARLDVISRRLDTTMASLAEARSQVTQRIASVTRALAELARLLDIRVRRDAPTCDARSGSDR